MDYQYLLFEARDGIGLLTINRPKALNALNAVIIDELNHFCETAALDESIKVIIITGSGNKAFVAGADISEMLPMSAEEACRFSKWGQSVFDRIEQLPKPVIAAVNGFALGGGCELSMACDIRIASENAKFGQPEVNLGIIAGYGGTQRLPRLVGKGMAMELLYTGEIIDAREACRIGLVNRVVPQDELLNCARDIAGRILGRAPLALQLTKSAVNRGIEVELKTGLAFEAEAFGLCFSTSDQKEGMAAFLDKRNPVFSGK